MIGKPKLIPEPNALVRLWDKNMKLLASEQVRCQMPDASTIKAEVTIVGKGQLHDTVKLRLIDGLIDEPLRLTYDPANPTGYPRRWGGNVTAVSVHEHRCECQGSLITKTTIEAMDYRAHLADITFR